MANPTEILQQIRKSGFPNGVADNLRFNQDLELESDAYKKHKTIRNEVIELLAFDFDKEDIEFIRFLTQEELKTTRHDLEHLGLSQCCAYLYILGFKPDVFLIYDCKYRPGSMDAGVMIEEDMLTLRQPESELVSFVKQSFVDKIVSESDYPDLISNLERIYSEPNYNSETEYLDYLHSYYGLYQE